MDTALTTKIEPITPKKNGQGNAFWGNGHEGQRRNKNNEIQSNRETKP